MEKLIHEGLPSLANELQFQVEKISGTDYYYTDGLAVGSFLKILLHRSKIIIPIYFYRSGDYTALGTLTEEERSILDGWLATLKSKKIE